MKYNPNYQNDELDLIDIIKILSSKAKILVCITLIAAILGGALGAAINLFGEKEYGTQIEFYITPTTTNSTVLHLLASERFSEQLLLDEHGLPQNSSGAQYDAALEAKLALNDARIAFDKAKEFSTKAPRALAVAQKTYEEKQKIYEDAYNILNVYKSAQSDKITEDPAHVQKMKQYEEDLEKAKLEKKVAEEAYYVASQDALKASHDLESTREQVTKAKLHYDELAEGLLVDWRNQAQNKKKISIINDSISYNYMEVAATDGSSGESANHQFLVVNIAVEKDEALANLLLSSMCEKLPTYVEEYIDTYEETDERETNCTLMSTATKIENLNGKTLAKEIVKYALLSTFMLLAVSCIAIVWIGVKKKNSQSEDSKKVEKEPSADTPDETSQN